MGMAAVHSQEESVNRMLVPGGSLGKGTGKMAVQYSVSRNEQKQNRGQ